MIRPGGLAIAFKDAVTGINNGDVYLVSGAIAALILEFVPPGKVFKTVWRTGRVVRKGFKFVKYSRRYLRSIGHALEAGLKADLDGSIVKISKNSDEIGIIKNGDLVPNKYGSSGSPIGDPEGGYQLYKNGDNFHYKRTPDVTGYSQSELSALTSHPNAHTLERHGHDVTDEALIKRSQSGIAPDGSSSTTPPAYSSKFESQLRLRDALQNTGPGTLGFNPSSTQTTFVQNITSTSSFGYGYPSGGSSKVIMNSVRAIYQKHNGVWKLLSMYPNP